MPSILSFGIFCAATVMAGTAFAVNIGKGDVQLDPNSRISEDPCGLYQGDLGAEIWIGCNHGFGPAFAAVGVTAPFATPFSISGYSYDILTSSNPALTALTFMVWAGGESPGAPIGGQAGLDLNAGHHMVPISPPIMVSSNQFFFGMVQPQTTWTARVGVDTSSGGGGNSFLKYPNCGLSAWQTMTSVGFAGDWTLAVCVSATVPIELNSWGQIKIGWN